MSDLLILGTDTDAGKTTFALLWLAALGDDYAYWKPLESGAADSECVQRLVPDVRVCPSIMHFPQPVAPLLAARQLGVAIPSAAALAAQRPALPDTRCYLLVETFGGPMSPLNETELQIALIQQLSMPTVLISASAVGAVGRTLQCLQALNRFRVQPVAVVLVGDPDPFALGQIARHGHHGRVVSLEPPTGWDPEGIRDAARRQIGVLRQIRDTLAALASEAPRAHSDLLERDRQSVWHPYTSLRDPDPPLVSVGAHDEFLELSDGRRVIDAISSWWTILHGHRHPVLMAALREASESFDHVHFAGVTHRHAVELAELLLSTLPWRGGRVFYSDDGSTAVEVALKMSYQYWCQRGEPGRTCFVGFENGYHGDTFGAMAVSRDPVFFGRFEPLLFRTEIVALSPERLEEVLARRSGEVAAVIVEPLVQGAGGMRMHTPQVLRALADVTRRHDVLFIADEVMTGGGRTGSLWAHQAAGIAPDLVCAAKTLAGGVLPLAATLVSPKVVTAWETDDPTQTFFHGHSFTAHPLACAVAVANWKMLTAQPPAAPERMERFWTESLAPLRDHPRVAEVRFCGTVAAVELRASGGYLADVKRQLGRVCLEMGVLVRPLGNVLYAMPPFCTFDESLRHIADALKHAICGSAG
jgi:adenosylmethionine-8-amino-7-oxononanoate aminotransferase